MTNDARLYLEMYARSRCSDGGYDERLFLSPHALVRFSAAAQKGATPKTRNAIHPGGHVPSTATAAASASATVLASRAGESTFNAHDVAAATSDAFDRDERGG